MNRITRLILGVVLTGPLAAAPADVSADLAKFTRDGKVPALVAAAVLNGRIIATGATGVRKSGDKTAVTVGDKFHIGSCTKSMTGSLAAMLVADGKIKWSTTVEEIFPKMKIHEDFKKATLLQLCSNTGGVPGDMPPELWKKTVEDRDKSETSQRANLVRALLTSPPAYPPGSKNVYSNGGFTIAGAMLEKVGGMTYQELIRTRLFKPLKMDSAGFGATATSDKVDQPYGHILREGEPFPIPAGLDADNPPAITPAGRVHLSIVDFAKYANFHLGVADNPPLKADSLKFLHTIVPPSENYAVGWVVVQRPWAGGTALNHNGTNTMNFAVMWLAPDKKFAAVAACNIDSDLGSKACDDAVSFLIGKFLTSGN
ncbi:beta-lactamase family protein [Luteolibacter yonseiensis]|uniref:Beta-lactamase family protein n=1 Tax=Luteolibacter yonseiensis TaxID=1144680 RepID=A0A934R277_9BACT|nr:serine hydrolase domain-containing protein [Luteolibacter yonseiensis]MBK1814170.1 beta-lactamase family protein [Luteolibacter yonseiensis]